ncbi:MAG: hypothetical protein JWR38_5976 [Mucilaginibacter sp.]|nr:hypothetical protein [Mucilaginibacter sp.]
MRDAAASASTEKAPVSVTSLHRYYAAMMQLLPNAVTASEVDISAWIQEYESSVITQTRHTALTMLEEEMLVQWIEDAASIYRGVDDETIKEKAREIIQSQRGIEWEGCTHVTSLHVDHHLGQHHTHDRTHWCVYMCKSV